MYVVDFVLLLTSPPRGKIFHRFRIFSLVEAGIRVGLINDDVAPSTVITQTTKSAVGVDNDDIMNLHLLPTISDISWPIHNCL